MFDLGEVGNGVLDQFGRLTEGVVEREVDRHLGVEANDTVSSNPETFKQPNHGEDGDGTGLINGPTPDPQLQPPQKDKTLVYAGVALGALAVVGVMLVLVKGK